MGEQVDSAGRRSDDGGVAERRHLVAEISSGDNRTCYPAGGNAHYCADAHEGDTDGGYCAPATAGKDGYNAADRAAYREEKRGAEDIETETYKHGNYAAKHPGCRYHCDTDEHGDGGKNLLGAAAYTYY